MTEPRAISKRTERTILIVILLLFAALSIVGITWGLPSRTIDKYLFGGDPPWPGETIHRLAGASAKFSRDRGADVDADPLAKPGDEPILLTGTDEDVAKIYLRYRLYTYQPDEMITMMALAGMNPRRLDLDPRLYQYGGLFIYPVGACIGACGLLGLIDVRGDVVHYLDHPDEFGKFYVVARAYSAAWGLLGVIVVFAITRRLASAMGGMGKRSLPVRPGATVSRSEAVNESDKARTANADDPHARAALGHGTRAALLAALLFTLMPVVVCMAHEGKPHLPGAVLMLLAVWFGMRHLSSERAAGFWLMAVCCGAAFGMVLSSWPIFVLIPLAAWLDVRRGASDFRGALTRTVGGVLLGVLVYLATNPYIVINAIVNRDVLRSNFGNSLAMYEVARIGEGSVRVLELTIEGATLPILVLGAVALVALLIQAAGGHGTPTAPQSGLCGPQSAIDAPLPQVRGLVRPSDLALVLAVPAVVFFVQFVLIGAGKPAEYGRFGIFTNTALAIGTACLLSSCGVRLPTMTGAVLTFVLVLWVGFFGAIYLHNFYADATNGGSRIRLAEGIAGDVGFSRLGSPVALAVLADPAPYSLPPVDFSRTEVLLFRSEDRFERTDGGHGAILVTPVDEQGSVEWNPPPDPSRLRPNRFKWPEAPPREGWNPLHRNWDRPTPISWANKPFNVAMPPP